MLKELLVKETCLDITSIVINIEYSESYRDQKNELIKNFFFKKKADDNI